MANPSGGVIPTEEDPLGAMSGSNNLSAALASVKSVLEFGRKLHGLNGDNDKPEEEGGVVNEAAAMPMAPPSQSESGVRPLQPAPGRLPPTSNPFGKRAEAEPEDEGGVIDTDEEA